MNTTCLGCGVPGVGCPQDALPPPPHTPHPTPDTLRTTWLDAHHLSAATRKKYVRELAAFHAFAAGRPPTALLVVDYLEGCRARGATPATLVWKRSIVARFLAFCTRAVLII